MLDDAQGGNDRLVGGRGNDTLYGDAGGTLFFDQSGNDRLDGGSGSDQLYGDAGELFGAQGGDDQLEGGSGSDNLFGDASSFRSAIGGNDRLEGGSGDDILYGDAVSLDGEEAGDGGDDLLIGGTGDDQLWGDGVLDVFFTGVPGADRFRFAPHSGQDTIFDFQLDKDVIEVAGGYGYSSFAELQPNISDDANGNAVVHLNGTVDQVTLNDVQTANLSAGDFFFV
jgi:Ca2+-binding RTX toxin-like protein